MMNFSHAHVLFSCCENVQNRSIHYPSAEPPLSSCPCLFQAKLIPVAFVFLLQVRQLCVVVSENLPFLERFSPRKLETDFKLAYSFFPPPAPALP